MTNWISFNAIRFVITDLPPITAGRSGVDVGIPLIACQFVGKGSGILVSILLVDAAIAVMGEVATMRPAIPFAFRARLAGLPFLVRDLGGGLVAEGFGEEQFDVGSWRCCCWCRCGVSSQCLKEKVEDRIGCSWGRRGRWQWLLHKCDLCRNQGCHGFPQRVVCSGEISDMVLQMVDFVLLVFYVFFDKVCRFDVVDGWDRHGACFQSSGGRSVRVIRYSTRKMVTVIRYSTKWIVGCSTKILNTTKVLLHKNQECVLTR